MDRLPRTLSACGLGLMMMAAAGCKITRPEVPPGRPYANDGRQRKAIEFSSEGHPVGAAATNNFMPNNLGGSNLASGIGSNAARPDASAFGAPPGAYGRPGTSGMARPDVDPAAVPAGLPPAADPSARTSPPAGLPPAPELDVAPAPAGATNPNQVIQAPMDTPGTMGAPNQMPSPN